MDIWYVIFWGIVSIILIWIVVILFANLIKVLQEIRDELRRII
jgi:hypothetical protein